MADADASDPHLAGELTLAPRGPVASVLWLVSGLAAVRAGLELLGRLALSYRRPATLRLSEKGLELSHRTTLLGRTLREGHTLVPLANLGSVTREVRFARLGLYAGLLALSLGTYVGAGLVVDGLRAPGTSPSLLGMGLVAITLGVVLDFLLAVVWDAVKQTSRVVIVQRRGPRLCMRGVDPAQADQVLTSLRAALPGPDPASEMATSAAPSPPDGPGEGEGDDARVAP